MFSNDVCLHRGFGLPNIEQYQDYRFYESRRHVYQDMIGDDNEVAAVLLCEAGIFPKKECFEPERTVSVSEFMNCVLKLEGLAVRDLPAEETVSLFELNGWLPEGMGEKAQMPLIREDMAEIIHEVLPEIDGIEQYELLMSDFEKISPSRQSSALFAAASGVMEIDRCFDPMRPVGRGEAAGALFRLKHPGSRVVPPFDLGEVYRENPGQSSYAVKTRMTPNPSGVLLGTWSRYNHQDVTFKHFGKRPVDRVDFYKWVLLEKEKGVYTIPNFFNDLKAHRHANTIITGIDLTANLQWNERFDRSNIPDFYEQDIENPETRQAAKDCLYAFVTEMMKAVRGDIILAIDYELDWQQMFERNTDDTCRRMPIFADWYVEACQTARRAAADAGAAGRLKLIVIYNNMCDVIKLGTLYNEWRMKCAAISDYVGIDSYDRYWLDRTNPALTLSNMRYLINNYSGGKPVMMVENGTPGDDEPDPFTGMNGRERQRQYYSKLFRAFRFELLPGGFLNNNLSAYLFWDLIDIKGNPSVHGVIDDEGIEKPAAAEIRKGFQAIEKQRQFCPSLWQETVAFKNGISFAVESGSEYDCLEIVTKENHTGKTLYIELAEPASVLLEQNGEGCFVSGEEKMCHEIPLEGNALGLHVYRLFFGAGKVPFENAVVSFKIL